MLAQVLKAIADHALRTSVIHVYVSNITRPTDAGFGLTLEGQVKKVRRSLLATIARFETPYRPVYSRRGSSSSDLPMSVFPSSPSQATLTRAQVYWINPDNGEELYLGNLNFASLGAAAGHAKLKQETYFNIGSLDGFGRFTEHLCVCPPRLRDAP